MPPALGAEVGDQACAGALTHRSDAGDGGGLVAERGRLRYHSSVRRPEPEPEIRVPVNEHFKHAGHKKILPVSGVLLGVDTGDQTGAHHCVRVPLLWSNDHKESVHLVVTSLLPAPGAHKTNHVNPG